ncbi:Oligosaccaryltransferase protein [Fusarium austroafricanum]|uniref:Dolichyl-diphosphooligosaccharide--protein glycosyltransferase subunit 4 n=1 Tax=Fusarium austroafricanum TaxID=2364996 RepID=A0A8H4JPS2_9HYPO|nr:Oligosaccaryltransferase protein [Fusarium austroafricanum]
MSREIFNSPVGRAKNPSSTVPSGQLKLLASTASRPSNNTVADYSKNSHNLSFSTRKTSFRNLQSLPRPTQLTCKTPRITTAMISDGDLYRLAIFFGTAAMALIVLYHFLEVNAVKEPNSKEAPKSL